jgi:leucine dehydrogenase
MDDTILNHPEYAGHEEVKYFSDPSTGLRGYIAIHSTKLGPAVGGTRYFHYENDMDALEDVLRLSHSMSYKSALAGVPFGGAKCVIIAPKNQEKKSKEFLHAYGKVLQAYDKKFYTGEDVGMSQEDIETIAEVTPNIIGTRAKAGDPSPWASLSVYYAIRGALRFLYGTIDLSGKKVAIKGLGKVGMELGRLLDEEGAELVVTDIDEKKVTEALSRFKKVSVASAETIHAAEVDIFAPCALGKDIRPETRDSINAKIVCGSANNQLATKEDGEFLLGKGIVYVPDYIANGGGLINVVAELDKMGYNKNTVLERCKEIENTTFSVLTLSTEQSLATNIVADQLAEKIIASGTPSHEI